jgi:hypothetical protein
VGPNVGRIDAHGCLPISGTRWPAGLRNDLGWYHDEAHAVCMVDAAEGTDWKPPKLPQTGWGHRETLLQRPSPCLGQQSGESPVNPPFSPTLHAIVCVGICKGTSLWSSNITQF